MSQAVVESLKASPFWKTKEEDKVNMLYTSGSRASVQWK